MNTKNRTSLRKHIYTTLGGLDKLLGRENGLIIYCYHNIHSNPWAFNVNLKKFEEQIDYLTKWGQPVTLSDVQEYLGQGKKLPERAFVVTFDDGYEGILDTVEILREKGVKPTVFLLPEEKKVHREELATECPLLTKKGVSELSDNGWEFGSHAISHRKLTKINPVEALSEIKQSKEKLENSTKRQIKFFAYPHGYHNKGIETMVKNSNYRLATSMDDALIGKRTNLFSVPRVGVMGNHSMEEFAVLGSPSVVAFRSLVKRSPLKKLI